MNVLYVVPNIEKVSGGPRTRISKFAKVFDSHGDKVIMVPQKFGKSLEIKKVELVYVESATNRISFVDFFSLLYLKFQSKKIIVFIRDVYTELFPDEFRSPRRRLTWILNKLSNLLLVLLSDTMVFPTTGMGMVFFKKNRFWPKKPFFALPPGTSEIKTQIAFPDLSKKIGILYLGSTVYTNAGFEHFLNFADLFKDAYTFFVLSGDVSAKEKISGRNHVHLDRVEHLKIRNFIDQNNILAAFHTRPRNAYDDITFPIKVLDFISFRLPFITDEHAPLKILLGTDYALFTNVSDYQKIHKKLQILKSQDKYIETVNLLAKISRENTYEERYKKLLRA